jgi:hypothetical protein
VYRKIIDFEIKVLINLKKLFAMIQDKKQKSDQGSKRKLSKEKNVEIINPLDAEEIVLPEEEVDPDILVDEDEIYDAASYETPPPGEGP